MYTFGEPLTCTMFLTSDRCLAFPAENNSIRPPIPVHVAGHLHLLQCGSSIARVAFELQSLTQCMTKDFSCCALALTLAVHLQVANLYGKGADKLSFDNRVQFARDHMHEVFDSADNPFTGAK